VATAALLVLGLGATVPASASGGNAEGVIANAGAEGTVPGSYIVVLADGFAANSVDGAALAAAYDAEITSTYKHALNGFAIETSEAKALELAADPAVATVVQNETVELFTDTQPNPPSWGLDRIDQADLPLDSSFTYPAHAGEGVTAYILDTGIRYSHEDFGDRATFGFDAFGGDGNDGNGHGTHVAGTVAGSSYGVAKAADLVSVKVLNDAGSGTIEGVVGGVDWVTGDASGPSVANMSLGGGANAVLDEAVRNSIAAGVTYAIAAGNSNADASGFSPARVGEAITVGSSTSTDGRSSFSNYGSVVDIFAPGTSITSAWHTGDTASNTISGTSMAAPHVAGAAALHLAENPAATPAEVESALVESAVYDRLSGIPSGTVNGLLHTAGEGGGAPEPLVPPTGKSFANTTDVAIEDHQTSTSTINVKGVNAKKLGNAFAVSVDIKHTWIGDLTIDVTAPDGTTWRVHDRAGGSTTDLLETYLLRVPAGLDPKGTWTLSVHDHASLDQGYLDSWGVQF
jgi:subtilisin family serine protease